MCTEWNNCCSSDNLQQVLELNKSNFLCYEIYQINQLLSRRKLLEAFVLFLDTINTIENNRNTLHHTPLLLFSIIPHSLFIFTDYFRSFTGSGKEAFFKKISNNYIEEKIKGGVKKKRSQFKQHVHLDPLKMNDFKRIVDLKIIITRKKL